MSEPTAADLAKMIMSLTTNVMNLQATVATLQKKKSASSSSSGGGNDGQHHNDRPPQFQKMDFLRYDGKSDPLIFINRCESYFHQQRIMEEEKVWMASYNLEDGAQLWYIQVQADEGTLSWRRFTELLNLRYGPPLRSALLFELADCRRTGTVEEYQDRFQALLPRAGRLGEAQRVQLFIGGLLPPLSLDVRVHNPQSLAVAMSRTRQLELREQRIFYIDGFELADDAAAADESDTDTPVFSLHAVAGVPVNNTIQLQVLLGAATFVALIDTGSTHSFIGEAAARRMGLRIEPRPQFTATVANGERVSCPGVLRQAPVIIDGMMFGVDLFVMPLAGYDVVFGTHWMATLGPIVWDFTARTMTFQQEGRDVCWRGVAPPTAPGLYAATTDNFLLDGLLGFFTDVFAEPTGLPPGPAAHKDELERQCAAMIEQGIVRRSDSAFSSSVLLVKKSDGSWRFCVDYRALNALTVKDAFPIPVVDELLDELHGARFFSKLDLRSGYHQSLMNDALCPFLRRFVLVFFDDILIYSKSWADHLRHLRAVLTELRHHRLFVKRSKCAFSVTSVSYLGHIISEAGVDMDPAKMQAIHDWPVLRSARAVRGFLGLTGYYRKFVHNYGSIAAPLTTLLKEGRLLLGRGGSRGLHSSRPVAPRHRALAAYERELIGLVHAVCHWRPYLWGRRFLIKTDHYNLKYLLDQRLATIPQHHWVGKLLGFDFSVEYKPALVALREDINTGSRQAPWSVVDGMIQFARWLYIPLSSPLVQEIVVAVHKDGQEGVQRTLHRLWRDFHFPNMKQLVQDLVRKCVAC
ncbi:hypothetical protein U9M48_028309 [Paspalum notatum var. saurae]|uniref:RNA-directed DNA polymerase n=1 Tax=Paspalum notatum var. saurae TaxID=547442 RepID=A0AAQ3U114_PASNO